MDRILRLLFRGLGRVFPGCVTLSQAIAFNMFLAFFPMLLLVLGGLSSKESFHTALRDLPEHLRVIIPPVSEDLSEGFRIIEGDLIQKGYLRTHGRALALLVLTSVPSLSVIILTVFGKQVRGWLILQVGLRVLITALAFIFQVAVIFALSMFVLVLLYRIGRPEHKGYMDLLPGAAVATVLWWVVDIFFGVYVRKMPYDVVYGGLAAAMGLLLWMYLTAIVVLLGAAYNAEWRESADAEQFPVEKGMALR